MLFPPRIVILAALLVSSAIAQTSLPVVSAESSYADFNDATAAIATIESGYSKTFGGKTLSAWKSERLGSRKELQSRLKKISVNGLSTSDRRAVTLMRAALSSEASRDPKPVSCGDVRRANLTYSELRRALTTCFDEVGNNLLFEGKKLTRGDAFGKLEQFDDPSRRKAVFLAMQPLYQAINGDDRSSSPYRRLIMLATTNNAKRHSSELDSAARTLGATPVQVEHWLEQILETWRQVSDEQMIEPWDYRYLAGAASRQLDSAISREQLQSINTKYYRDLGADLTQLGIIYDLDPRHGKSPVAYTDFARRGRDINNQWQPTIARVLANYSDGGLGNLNEYIHENGHAVQISAIHTSPAFMDWGDTVFVEAFADVPSWNTYDPDWQKKYLGRSASENDNLRALYSGVMLDIAWSLFEVRMLQKPTQDPNRLWTEITSHYLHIVSHPDMSWWAVRVQLVDAPGYMVNYGLGAIITADLQARITEKTGSFAEGNARWYPWLSENLLRFGTERETSQLLVEFLGRPVSTDALLTDIRRLTSLSDRPRQSATTSLTTSH